jgi:NAD(P)-dependent dehydrogenase (short-subunit alcohol dehydrogenase family)
MSGTIVNYPQEQASYNASKAAVAHLTKSLAVEWARYGIRVNCISPGYIVTEMTGMARRDYIEKWLELSPYKRMGKPEELSGAVVYLASDCSSFTSGCDLVIDGCFTVV